MEEIFKDIEGYKGIYQVSNLGNIKSLTRIYKWYGTTRQVKEKILKLNKGTTGYYLVILTNKNQKRETKKVHRLVAKAFLKIEGNKNIVNHKDGNKLNNNTDNLEWCTYSENSIHAYETGLNPRHTFSKEELMELYITKRKGMKQIAKEKGIEINSVKRELKRNDIKIRSLSEERMGFELTKGFLEKELMYKTQKQIALEIGVERHTISKYKKKFNL